MSWLLAPNADGGYGIAVHPTEEDAAQHAANWRDGAGLPMAEPRLIPDSDKWGVWVRR